MEIKKKEEKQRNLQPVMPNVGIYILLYLWTDDHIKMFKTLMDY